MSEENKTETKVEPTNAEIKANEEMVVEAVAKSEPKAESKKLDEAELRDYKKSTVAELGEEKHKLLKEVMDKKARLAKMAEENASLSEQLEQIRKTELEKQGEWQQLYEQEKERANLLETGIVEREQKMVDIHKMHAVAEKISFRKPEYRTFIDKKAIVLDENGKIDNESLNAEVERVKQFHSELINKDIKSNLPNSAPDSKEPTKPLGDMNQAELIASIMKSGKF